MSGALIFDSKRCLITGSTGYIGSALVQDLRARRAVVRTMEGEKTSDDITVNSNVGRIFNEGPYDFVFHLAAKTNLPFSWQHPAEYFKVNVVATHNILEALRTCKNDQYVSLVYTSSSSVYGVSSSHRIQEYERLKPVSPYGVSKACAETLCVGYHDAFGLQIKIARPFYVTGYGCKRGVVFEVANAIAIAERQPAEKIHEIAIADPEVTLDVIDIRDCVSALETIAIYGRGGEAYNVSTGEEHSVGEIVEVLLSKTTAKIRVRHARNKRPSDTPRLVGDNSRLRRLGWKNKFSFEQTIGEVLRYCRSTVGQNQRGTLK